MAAYRRYFMASIVVLCVVLSNALPASANSVAVMGSAFVGLPNEVINITAGVGIWSASVDGPEQIGNYSGYPVGVPITVSWDAYTYPGHFNSGPGYLVGTIHFTATFTVPPSALVVGSFTQFTVPISVLGNIQSFQDILLPDGEELQGPLIWSLVFKGSGTATLTLNGYNSDTRTFLIREANTDFTGTGNLTAVPEPTSLVFMGTGLSGLAVVVRRFGRNCAHASRVQP